MLNQSKHRTSFLSIAFMLCLMLSLTQCSSYDFSRRLVQQGNLLPQSKINRLHPGLTKEAVAAIMGTSLLSPMFNEQRWDYAFTQRIGTDPLLLRHMTLYFKHDHLVKIEQK